MDSLLRMSNSLVECLECGCFFYTLEVHVRVHGITIGDYRYKHPDVKTSSETCDENRRKGQERKWSRPEEHSKLSEKVRETWNSPEYRANISEAISKGQTKRFESPEERYKVSVGVSKWFEDPSKRLEASRTISKVYRDNPEIIEKIRKGVKNYWKSLSPEDHEKRVKPFRESKRPRGHDYLLFQTIFYNYLEEYFPDNWTHNGGQPNAIRVGGLEPDFIHKSKHLVIEYFECWPHGYSVEEEKSKRFKYRKVGYELLVIREEDFILPETRCKIPEKVSEFIKNRSVS